MKHTARAVSSILRAYQRFISPLLPARCRFYPSCSAYALEAVELHGAGRGLLLGARRVTRCHPWGSGGFDPVPRDLRKTPNKERLKDSPIPAKADR